MSRTSSYADLEIRIRKKEAAGYPVEITFNHEREFKAGYLDPAKVAAWRPGLSAAEDGQSLFALLATDAAFVRAWTEARGLAAQRRIRLRLDAQAPELHPLPWECLRDDDNELAASAATPFSRYLAGKWQPGSPILTRPINILVAVADPVNLETYQLQPIERETEWALLQQAVADVAGVNLELLDGPCTLPAIEARLQQGGCHILHFIGHGKFSDKRQEMALYMADKDNQVDLVNGQALAQMLTRQLADVDAQREEKLRLVFLASCQTATQSQADAFRSVAPALVAAGVPAVSIRQPSVPMGAGLSAGVMTIPCGCGWAIRVYFCRRRMP